MTRRNQWSAYRDLSVLSRATLGALFLFAIGCASPQSIPDYEIMPEVEKLKRDAERELKDGIEDALEDGLSDLQDSIFKRMSNKKPAPDSTIEAKEAHSQHSKNHLLKVELESFTANNDVDLLDTSTAVRLVFEYLRWQLKSLSVVELRCVIEVSDSYLDQTDDWHPTVPELIAEGEACGLEFPF